ncbi:hypothetical protein [Lentisalinibacter salinarum]|uniref:hypothetical protein n=1 Tax=Lentisalinibacter salinarum TaxID=2992239 RepID=UPI00386D51C6
MRHGTLRFGEAMRRLLKFLHTMSTIGITGGLAAYMLVLATAPPVESLEAYAAMRESLAMLSKWLILPSMLIVVLSGLLAIAAHFPFAEAPWVWAKALAGILVFESTLMAIDGPAQRAAALSEKALGGEIASAELAGLVSDEWGAWWILLGLFTANVLLAIWRPRFGLKGK